MSLNGSRIFTDKDFPPLEPTPALQASASSNKKLAAKASPESSHSLVSTSTSSVPSSTLVSTPKESTMAISPQVKLSNQLLEFSERVIKDNYALERLWPGQTDTVPRRRIITFEDTAMVLPSMKYRRPRSETVGPFYPKDLGFPEFVGLARLFPANCPEAMIVQKAKEESGGVDIPGNTLSYDYVVVFANASRTRFWRHAIDIATGRCAFIIFPPVIDLHEKGMMMVLDRSRAGRPQPRYLEVPIVRPMTREEYDKFNGFNIDRTCYPSPAYFYSEMLEDCRTRRSGCH